MPAPYHLLRYQGAMLRASAAMLMPTALRRLLAPCTQAVTVIERSIAAPPAVLVDAYLDWCGGRGRYADQLPPHMVSQWSLPAVSALLRHLPYRLSTIINQGVSIAVHGPLPRNEVLTLKASVQDIVHADGWAKITIAIVTGSAQQANAVDTRLHLRVRLSEAQHRNSRSRSPASDTPLPDWHTVGHWRAEAGDGLHFALLTGDFNPIHWCGPLARRLAFAGRVLHGFGSLARTVETLAPHTVRQIELRFLRPVALPCMALAVQLARTPDDQGWRALRLAGPDQALHLAGRLLTRH